MPRGHREFFSVITKLIKYLNDSPEIKQPASEKFQKRAAVI